MKWKEIISRFTMVLFAAVIAVIGTLFVFAGRFLLESIPKMALLFFIAAGFNYLIGGTLLCFAFMPGRDTRTGPPRGFVAVNAVFDRYWEVVEKLLQHM